MKRFPNYILLLLLINFFHLDIIAQTETQKKIDSLNLILRNAVEDTSKVNHLNALVWELYQSADFKKSREVAAESIKLAEKTGFKKGKADALRHLGTIEWETGNYEKSMEYSVSAGKIYMEIGDKLIYGDCLNAIGNIHWAKSDYANAIKNYKQAIEIYKELKDTASIVRTNNNLGSASGMQGNHNAALSYYFEVLRLTRTKGDKILFALCTRNIGETYFALKNYPEALRKYEEALAIYQQVGRKVGVANTYRIIGNYYEAIGQYPEALANYSMSFKLFTEMGDAGPISSANNNIGRIYLIQANYDEALKCFHEAAEIQEAKGSKQPLVVSWINIADALFRQAKLVNDRDIKTNNLNEAITILSKAIDLAKGIGIKEDLKNAYGLLSDIYSEKNDFRKALDFHTRYSVLKDSLLNNETTRKLEQQRTQYEVEKSVEEEKAKNQVAMAEQKAGLKRKNELLLGGFTVLAIITFLIVLLIRQRNQKKREIEKAETGHKMAELELQSLRAQLNPHFMFNSLNAIQDLILKEDNDRSHLYLSRFSKLLRMLLDNANQPFISIKQELELIELYLSLENLRIPNLQYSIERNPKLGNDERMIPNMMLQPYIENAIWHGLSNKKGERKLQLRIHENAAAIEFEIEDNGIGRKKAAEIKAQYRQGHHSKGMELLSKRFNLLSKEYGEAILTTVTDLENNGEAAGTLVKIDVPFSLSEQAR